MEFLAITRVSDCKAVGAAAGFGNAVGGQRVGSKILRWPFTHGARDPVKPLEETRHALGFIAAAGQQRNANAVGLGLGLASMADLELLGQAHAAKHDGLGGIAIGPGDRKSTRLNSSHVAISYA